tara:strand:+ start:2398 stop:2625 length:228 start_codon:yes stop_codon:yes gene_type:complete
MDFKMTNNGYTVHCNGVTISKPKHMSDDYWFKYEAPRVGKFYGSSKTKDLYGQDLKKVTHGVEEMEDGCGGACSI